MSDPLDDISASGSSLYERLVPFHRDQGHDRSCFIESELILAGAFIGSAPDGDALVANTRAEGWYDGTKDPKALFVPHQEMSAIGLSWFRGIHEAPTVSELENALSAIERTTTQGLVLEEHGIKTEIHRHYGFAESASVQVRDLLEQERGVIAVFRMNALPQFAGLSGDWHHAAVVAEIIDTDQGEFVRCVDSNAAFVTGDTNATTVDYPASQFFQAVAAAHISRSFITATKDSVPQYTDRDAEERYGLRPSQFLIQSDTDETVV